MKAVTTPPHLPVFTGNTMGLSVDLRRVKSAGAYSLRSPFHSEGSEWRRSYSRHYSRSKEEQALLHSCWYSAYYPCPRSSLTQYRKLVHASTRRDRPTPFSRVSIEMSGVGENARVIGEDVLSTLADRVGRTRIERKRVKWVAPAETELGNHQNIRQPSLGACMRSTAHLASPAIAKLATAGSRGWT